MAINTQNSTFAAAMLSYAIPNRVATTICLSAAPASLLLPGGVSLPSLNKRRSLLWSRSRHRISSVSASLNIPSPHTLETETQLESMIWEIKDAFTDHVNLLKNNCTTFTSGVESVTPVCRLLFGIMAWLGSAQEAQANGNRGTDMIYEVAELFELGIQLSYLLILLGLLGVGTFFVIRQVLVRRELDLSAKELQEQVRSGDASATGYFELGAVMLRRKFYPAAIKYLQQAIEKWDGDDQDLAQVYNALGVSYVNDNKLDKAILQFEKAVKLQPGYVTAWNNLGDAYEKKKDLKAALKAFEEVILFDPNNKVARPRRDTLKQRVQMYEGVPVKSKEN